MGCQRQAHEMLSGMSGDRPRDRLPKGPSVLGQAGPVFATAHFDRQPMLARGVLADGAEVDEVVCYDVHCSVLSDGVSRSEEHTSELQSLMRISYAVFCLNKKQPMLQ